MASSLTYGLHNRLCGPGRSQKNIDEDDSDEIHFRTNLHGLAIPPHLTHTSHCD